MNPTARIKVEQGVAAVIGALALLSCFWRDWIEGLTGWDPDHHSGSAELGVVLGLFAVAAAAFAVSRVERRRLATATTAA